MRKRKAKRWLLMAAALLWLAACGADRARSTSGDANPAEVRFTTNAFNIVEFDRQEGALARTQAQSPAVKAIAQQLTNQADEFAARLAPTAAAAGIKPPTVLRDDLRVRLGHMRLQQGLDFDHTYVADQIASHEEVLRMEQGMGDAGVSPQFATLMQQGIGLVRENLDKLRALQAQLGPGRNRGRVF